MEVVVSVITGQRGYPVRVGKLHEAYRAFVVICMNLGIKNGGKRFDRSRVVDANAALGFLQVALVRLNPWQAAEAHSPVVKMAANEL